MAARPRHPRQRPAQTVGPGDRPRHPLDETGLSSLVRSPEVREASSATLVHRHAPHEKGCQTMSSFTPSPQTPPAATPPTSRLRARSGARPGPIIMLILGTVLGLVGAGMLSGVRRSPSSPPRRGMTATSPRRPRPSLLIPRRSPRRTWTLARTSEYRPASGSTLPRCALRRAMWRPTRTSSSASRRAPTLIPTSPT